MDLHAYFEELSRLKVRDSDNLDDLLARLGEKLCVCLHVERVNVWLFKSDPNRIECLGNFKKKDNIFTKGEVLTEAKIPSYFAHLQSDNVIRIENVYTDEISAELKDTYCVDNHVFAIMDIPVRIKGNLEGVICFEDCKSERNWTDEEKNFAIAVSQIVSLYIENEKRKKLQRKLEKALEDKNTLLVEMHHRVKNNLTMLVSLLRLQSRNVTDKKALDIFLNFENQMLSISKLHEQLYVSENFLSINLKTYFEELLKNFMLVLDRRNIIHTLFEDCYTKAHQAVTIGLIINEILNNAFKHAQTEGRKLMIDFEMRTQSEAIKLRISDNGPGFDMESMKDLSFGLSLIYDLSEQIDAKIDFQSSESGTTYTILLNG